MRRRVATLGFVVPLVPAALGVMLLTACVVLRPDRRFFEFVGRER
jgi:hypothetical protein